MRGEGSGDALRHPQNQSEQPSALQRIAWSLIRRIVGVVVLYRDKDSERVEEMGGVAGCDAFFGMSDFKKLVVWQKAHALAIHAHRTAVEIRESRYASLRSQIIRSAMSIPANIVEGRRQESERDFARFLRYSLNSAYELEYHLMFAREIDVIADEEARSLLAELVEVRRMLHGLLKRISPKNPDPRPSETDAPV